MKPHDVAGIETTGLSIPLPSVMIRSVVGRRPGRTRIASPVGGRRPAVAGSMPLSVTGRSNVMRTWPGRGRHRSTVLDLKASRDTTRLEGFNIPRGVRSGPQEMRIPPLRSAVQMGSDVSPGSSVTLGRRVSSDAHR